MIQHQNQVSIIAEICPSISRPALSRHKKHIHTWKLQDNSAVPVNFVPAEIKKPSNIEDYKNILRNSTVDLLSKPSRTQAEENRLLQTLSLLKQMEESPAQSVKPNTMNPIFMAELATKIVAEEQENSFESPGWKWGYEHRRLLREVTPEGNQMDNWLMPWDSRYPLVPITENQRRCIVPGCPICSPYPPKNPLRV